MIRRPLPVHRRLQQRSAWRRRAEEARKAELARVSREIDRNRDRALASKVPVPSVPPLAQPTQHD